MFDKKQRQDQDQSDQKRDRHEGSSERRTEQVETDPAVERGERIQTGKTIARGGRSRGPVRGAEKSS